jgi:hypothetical protein
MSNDDLFRICVEWKEAVRGDEGVGEEGAMGIAAYSKVPNLGGTGGGFILRTITVPLKDEGQADDGEKKRTVISHSHRRFRQASQESSESHR